MLDLGEDATGGIQLANLDGRRYHLRNVVENEAVGQCMDKYRRLKQSAVHSSVGSWDAGPSLDSIAVRGRVEEVR